MKNPVFVRRHKVMVADQHPVVAEGLRMMLDTTSDLEFCGHALYGVQALELIRERKPRLVMTEISFGQGRNGLELIKEAMACHPGLQFLVYSSHAESLYSERALRAGARGYLSKCLPMADVLQAIRKVLGGEICLSDRMNALLLERFLQGGSKGEPDSMAQLTDRELEVFEMIGRSLGSREIARELSLDLKTIETYRGRIKRKLQLANAVELHQRALQWLQSGEFAK